MIDLSPPPPTSSPAPAPHAADVVVVDELSNVVASPERIRGWLRLARAGDEFVYATRMFLPAQAPGAVLVRVLAAQGLVNPAQRRIAGRDLRNYVMQRTSVPLASPAHVERAARPVLAAKLDVPIEDEKSAIDAIYDVLARWAQFGRPCPTDAQLASYAAIPRDVVPATLEAMSGFGMIRVQRVSAPTCRLVTIVATGHQTGYAK